MKVSLCGRTLSISTSLAKVSKDGKYLLNLNLNINIGLSSISKCGDLINMESLTILLTA